MKLPRRQFLHLAAGVAAPPVVSRVVWAQTYPARPVRICSEQVREFKVLIAQGNLFKVLDEV
jgi:hypothetical protein